MRSSTDATTRHAVDLATAQHDGCGDNAPTNEDTSCAQSTTRACDLEDNVVSAAFDLAAKVREAGTYEEIVSAAFDLAEIVGEYGEAVEEEGERARRAGRAVQLLFEFEAWLRDNPQAFAGVESLALNRAAEGKRTERQQILAHVSQHDYADVHGRRASANHNHGALLVRYLVALHPHLANFVETRASVFDAFSAAQLRALRLG